MKQMRTEFTARLSAKVKAAFFGAFIDQQGALGGSLEVTSAPGRGTTIQGRVPLRMT